MNDNIQTIDDLLNEREKHVRDATKMNESEIYNEGYIAGYNQASKDFVDDLKKFRTGYLYDADLITKDSFMDFIKKWEGK